MNLWDLACAFDWITPAKAFLDDARLGPPADFGMPGNAYWGKREIKRLLSRNGVRVWGLIYTNNLLIFTVPKAQAKWAYHLLKREGIPLEYVPHEAFDDGMVTTHRYSFWDALLGRIPE